MLYCINKDKVEKTAGTKTAGKKAPDDITELSCKMGGQRVSFTMDDSTIKVLTLRKAKNIYYSYRDWKRLYNKIRHGDIIIVQHPYEGIQAGLKYIPLIQNNGAKVICLIHDIRALRDSIDESSSFLTKNKSNSSEIKMLAICDYVIAHNKAMKQYLVNQLNIDAKKIHILGIFDYLCTNVNKDRKFDRSIAIAGNLNKSKCKYLYSMLESKEIKVPLHLYGPNYEGDFKGVNYHGVISPNELPSLMEGSFGLVWDGDGIDGCGGVAGEYLKYNNPHKCSLYLAAGVPVIIWKQAALAPFIEENGVGIIVNNLYEAIEIISNMTKDQYFIYKKKVEEVRRLIISGHYFKNVIMELMNDAQVSF